MASRQTDFAAEHNEPWTLHFGARPHADGSTSFRVWAPLVERLSVQLLGAAPRTVELQRSTDDVFTANVPNTSAGVDYFYVLDDRQQRPDPVSRWQPAGVHGPSRVFDPAAFQWTDADWRGLPLKDFLIYELHVGTFTPAGTFAGVIEKLPYLRDLGITAIELMPVAEFPGGRNWGYDGAHPYAPQSTYGGPTGLKQLIDACHRTGLAVVLDVVYNHLGPEGNYLGEYAPIFGHNYRTPWGDALNFDDAHSDGVRRYFIENALYWLTEYHVDALRLDAVHRIIDISPRHLLAELSAAFHAQAQRLGRHAWTIAESDLNDVRLIAPAAACGYGLDAQWSDDFHHALHALLTGIDRGYFADFGRVAQLAQAIQAGFVYSGQMSAFRRKRHGTDAAARPGEQFVVCVQNHDQIANGYWGERLAALVSGAQQKLAAALLLCAPNLPLLFMGQEWGETNPFLYFTSHTDEALGAAVGQGRRKEYAAFIADADAATTTARGFADPQAPATFLQSQLDWTRLTQTPQAEVLAFYRALFALRKKYECLSNCDKQATRVAFDEAQRWLTVERGSADGPHALLLCNINSAAQPVPFTPAAAGVWRLALWSEASEYGGDAQTAAPPSEVVVTDAGAAEPARLQLPGWGVALYVRG